jgi:hypothetical protein
MRHESGRMEVVELHIRIDDKRYKIQFTTEYETKKQLQVGFGSTHKHGNPSDADRSGTTDT